VNVGAGSQVDRSRRKSRTAEIGPAPDGGRSRKVARDPETARTPELKQASDKVRLELGRTSGRVRAEPGRTSGKVHPELGRTSELNWISEHVLVPEVFFTAEDVPTPDGDRPPDGDRGSELGRGLAVGGASEPDLGPDGPVRDGGRASAAGCGRPGRRVLIGGAILGTSSLP
jgi:hypothetical protein